MTVEELRRAIKDAPADAEVFFAVVEGGGVQDYIPVHSVDADEPGTVKLFPPV